MPLIYKTQLYGINRNDNLYDSTYTCFLLFHLQEVMTKQHPEVSSLANELKLIKDDLANNWQKMSEEQIECLQEEMRDIQQYIKRLLRKQ